MDTTLFPKGIELVGSALIENDTKDILLTQSPKWNNKWTLPGGHIEPGETIIEAQIREGREETGLILDPQKIIYWGEVINPSDFHRSAHFVFFVVYCKIIRGTIKLEETELVNYVWVTPEEALRMDLANTYSETIQHFITYKKQHHG